MSQLTGRLKSKLLEKGISAHALERSAGLKQSAVHNILQGKSKNPTLHTLQAICRALDCPMDELVDDLTVPKKQDVAWNAELYQEAMDNSIKLFKKNERQVTQEQALNFINEVYLYSIQGNKKHIDQTFMQWLYDKFWTK